MAKRILKIIGSLSCALVLALGTFFVPKLRTSEAEIANASVLNYSDNTQLNGWEFTSSNIILSRPGTMTSSTFSNDFSDYLNVYDCEFLNYSFQLYSFGGTIMYYFKAHSSKSTYLGTTKDSTGYSTFELIYEVEYDYLDLTFDDTDGVNRYFYCPDDLENFPLYYNGSQSRYSTLGIALFYLGDEGTLPSNPELDSTFKIYSVDILNSYSWRSIYGFDCPYTNSNILVYNGSNGLRFAYFIPNQVAVSSQNATNPQYIENNYFTYRRYYFESILSASDNQMYNQGYQDGYTSGLDDGKGVSYVDGYRVGYNVGKNEGYEEGLVASNKLTFSALMTSVIDVPVKVFVNLFDFDILGINILVFLSTLLTICLVLFLIKKIKGA